MGGMHKTCNVDDICVDNKNKLVTTPLYTPANNVAEATDGIETLINKIIAWEK